MHIALRGLALGMLASAALALGAGSARAHYDLAERIAQLSERIAAAPGDGSLYIERGRYRTELRDYDGALADFAKAAQLRPADPEPAEQAALACIQAGRMPQAKKHAQRLLKLAGAERRSGARAHLLLGEIAAAGKSTKVAAKHFERALELGQYRRPDEFVKIAGFYLNAGDGRAALAVTERALAALGPLPLLLDLKAKAAAAAGETALALKTLDEAIAGGRRLHILWREKARVLRDAGRPRDASAAYSKALEEFYAGQKMRRATKANQAFVAETVAEQHALEASQSRPGR